MSPSQTPPPLPEGTEFVDLFVVDVNGLPRGKRVPASAWPGIVKNGVAFSASALVLDATGASRGPLGIGTADGDPDGIAFPVLSTLAPVPWARFPTAQCLLAMGGDPAPWFDPRAILAGVVEQCRADGILPVVACELEFCLVGEVPAQATESRHLAMQNLEDKAGFLVALGRALAAQHVPSGAMVSEYGPGQFELNLPHGPDPLVAADQAVLQRRATQGVAASQGLRASFMAKPYAQFSGNGLHIHMSLVDTAGANRFTPPEGEALLRAAVAGMQLLHAQSMALFAPNFSAYRRYRAGSFVSLSSAWGEDNRSVAFRIPAGGRASRRVEHRVAGADASPHLVMAALLAAVHYGVTQKLVPTEPVRGASEQVDPRLPTDIFGALTALENADILPRYFPPRFLSLFAALKRAEAQDLLAEVFAREHAFYL